MSLLHNRKIDRAAKPLNAGEVVCIEPGVRHWHGAVKDSWFSHLSISVPKDDGSGKSGTDWLEAVSDEAYGKLD